MRKTPMISTQQQVKQFISAILGRLQCLRLIYRLLFLSIASSILGRLCLDLIGDMRLVGRYNGEAAMNGIVKYHNLFFPTDHFEANRAAIVFVWTVAIPTVMFLFSVGGSPKVSRRLGPFMALATVWLSSIYIASLLLGPGGFIGTTVFFNWARTFQCFSLAFWKPAKVSRLFGDQPDDSSEISVQNPEVVAHARQAFDVLVPRWPLVRENPSGPLRLYLLTAGLLLGFNSLYLTAYTIVMVGVLVVNLKPA